MAATGFGRQSKRPPANRPKHALLR